MRLEETIAHAGCTISVYRDETCDSPRRGDDSLTRLVSWHPDYVSPDPVGREQEAYERGGWPLLDRWLRLAEGALYTQEVQVNGRHAVVYITRDAVQNLCGDGAQYRRTLWLEEQARIDVAQYSAWAAGDCYGRIVRTPAGVELDACWGYIVADEADREYMLSEAKAAAEAWHASRRCRYDDCVNGLPVADDEQQVTCPACRRYMGLPGLDDNGLEAAGIVGAEIERGARHDADVLPEGLRYEDGQILDAQDHVWVTIHPAGLGDPEQWRDSIVAAVTGALLEEVPA